MKKTRKVQVPHRNQSPTGWWLFREIQFWVSDRRKKLGPTSRCPVWENTRLLRAKNREEALAKALCLARDGHPSKTRGAEWRSGGISQLLPIYEELEDGAEILWDKLGSLSVARIKRLAKSKRQLSVFNDEE